MGQDSFVDGPRNTGARLCQHLPVRASLSILVVHADANKSFNRGFGFAINRKTGAIIAGVIILVCVAGLIYSFYKERAAIKRRRAAAFGAATAQEYGEQPWRRNQGSAENSAPPGYQPPSQQPIGLQSTSPWKSSDETGVGKAYEDEDLGASNFQRPRDFS